MIDHLFSAVLTFCLLAGGTVAVGSLMFEAPHVKAAQIRVVELPRVEVVGHRLAASAVVARTETSGTAAQRTQ